MFIHFAFGSLGKQGKTEEQTKLVVEYILKEKRLLVSKCTEFIPAFPIKGAKKIPRDLWEITDYGMKADLDIKDQNWFSKLPDDTMIHYLQQDVPMICFIKIAFNKLRISTHSNDAFVKVSIKSCLLKLAAIFLLICVVNIDCVLPTGHLY